MAIHTRHPITETSRPAMIWTFLAIIALILVAYATYAAYERTQHETIPDNQAAVTHPAAPKTVLSN